MQRRPMSEQRTWLGPHILIWCAIATLGAACSLTELPPPASPDNEGGGGSEGGGATVMDMDTECQTVDDCNATGDCVTSECVEGRCVYANVPYTPKPNQSHGDCQEVWCKDGGDDIHFMSDDKPDNTNPCIAYECKEDQGLVVSGTNALCALASSSTEDGFCTENQPGIEAECVQCLDDSHCEDPNAPVCSDANGCVAQHCKNATFDPNEGETGIDCGGGDCSPCADDSGCVTGADCANEVCDPDTKTCTSSCNDVVKNAAETDVDCGGPKCSPCADHALCNDGKDCQSGVCIIALGDNVKTCAAPTCIDGVTNQSESDVDCGGTDCALCADGKNCNEVADCASSVCDPELSICTSSCSDGVQNGTENGVDCGGGCNNLCDIGGQSGGLHQGGVIEQP